ncbi:MAG: hypothetical protein BWY87_00760 [Deltaproteobacteria bacterium ADurb.Bin510]|nr:MAG: hypothetical protein BWY87_00760 [Deltaproteobacteria bacterium ADurb.Bin510]
MYLSNLYEVLRSVFMMLSILSKLKSGLASSLMIWSLVSLRPGIVALLISWGRLKK